MVRCLIIVVMFTLLSGYCVMAGPDDERIDATLKGQKLDNRISAGNLSVKREDAKQDFRLKDSVVKNEPQDNALAVKAAAISLARDMLKKKRVAATR